jgi:hypothetical protein
MNDQGGVLTLPASRTGSNCSQGAYDITAKAFVHCITPPPRVLSM